MVDNYHPYLLERRIMKTAYPNTREPVSITLYRNVPFDNTYKHHSMISDRFKYNDVAVYEESTTIPCERFLDMRKRTPASHPYVFPRTTKPGDVYNFEYGNGLITKITLELTPEETNSNYMKVVCGDDIYYYFITSIVQENFETYKLSLELDVIMTYQDEFLDGIKDVPVFTERKHSHRYTNDGLVPYCADFKTGDSAFSGCKPSMLKRFKPLHFYDSRLKLIEGLYWLYVCLDNKLEYQGSTASPLFTCKGKTYPLTMLVAPIGDFTSITYQKSDGTNSQTYTYDEVVNGISQLIGDGSVHGCKVSPYPPVNIVVGGNTNIIKSQKAYSIQCSDVLKDTTFDIYRMKSNDNILYYGEMGALPGTMLFKLMDKGFMILASQGNTEYVLDNLLLNDLGIVNSSAPSISDVRYDDPKLLFSPFKKYLLTSQYAGEGYQFYPELEMCNTPLNGNDSLCGFTTHTTAYIGDNNYYTEIKKSVIGSVFNLYKYEKLGLSCNINYLIPSGTDALDVFNTTQQQSFYTSKVASGITSGLSVAGGIASIVVGAGMTGASAGTLSPAGVGLVMGGATAIASGVAGIATTIKSADAHIQDLKNTPQSINVSGGNFQFDDALLGEETNGKPYVVVYDVPQVIKDNANDYFYQFGYEVARCCYFNTDLFYDASSDKLVDNNLFGRTIFNYIQIKEDITNKINADIPLIVKQKLSTIFNNGITIWNFFGFSYMWRDDGNIITADYDYNNWFMKNTYDNTEYKGDYYE